MTRLVTWINQSTDYLGTEIFRGATLDPENLPEPVATVGPVAQGVRAEWPDRDGEGDLCYLVRDFDGEGVGEVSEGYCFEGLAIGDEFGGGVYAGNITYSDGRSYMIIFAKQDGESSNIQWSTTTSVTGINDEDDGKANTDAAIADSGNSYPAFDHCVNYTDGEGNDDYYLPARNEIALVDNLQGHAEFSTSPSTVRWSSTEVDASNAYARRFSNGEELAIGKINQPFARPIRRVPV